MASSQTYDQLIDQFASGIARICGIYGISPMLGRLYGILFVSPGPMHLGALAQATGAAKSTVSVAVRKLERLKLVKRHWKKGDRRDYYEAETDLLAVLLEWLRMFVVPEVQVCQELSVVLDDGLSQRAGDDWPDEQGMVELRRRAAMLRNMTAMGQVMLEQALAGGPATSAPNPLAAVATMFRAQSSLNQEQPTTERVADHASPDEPAIEAQPGHPTDERR